jgi:hypothetical protein
MDQAQAAQLEAGVRAAAARLDELEASAKARNARAEMDEISGLREYRDRLRQHVADAKQVARADFESMQRRVSTELRAFREAIADVRSRYSEWDASREKLFNARLDQADAVLRRSTAEAAGAVAGVRMKIDEARDDLQRRIALARRDYDAWRERRSDQQLMKNLDISERALQDAFDDYAASVASVVRRAADTDTP